MRFCHSRRGRKLYEIIRKEREALGLCQITAMYTRDTTVINPHGIHARPASTFVKEASRWISNIQIANLSQPDKKPANAKSIITVLTLGMSLGSRVSITAEGADEQEAVDVLIALIDSGLGE